MLSTRVGCTRSSGTCHTPAMRAASCAICLARKKQEEHSLCLDDSGAVVDAIRRTVADVILVGMGNPRQELWLDNNLPATGCQLGVAVGALLDFLAGEVPRAGEWTRAARLEWVHRLFCEPKRLSSR